MHLWGRGSAAQMVWLGNTSLGQLNPQPEREEQFGLGRIPLHRPRPCRAVAWLHLGAGQHSPCLLHPTGRGIVHFSSSRASPRATAEPVVLSTGNIWGSARAAPSNVSQMPELQRGMAKPREIAQPDCSRGLVFCRNSRVPDPLLKPHTCLLSLFRRSHAGEETRTLRRLQNPCRNAHVCAG